MASDETLLGTFTDVSGEGFEVLAKGRLVLLRGDQCTTVLLGPEALADLRELLDRAAMPGRPAATGRPSSRCTWWSDPSDDFYGKCVKEAGHDREGLDDEREHENEHGIRWHGRRWEQSGA